MNLYICVKKWSRLNSGVVANRDCFAIKEGFK